MLDALRRSSICVLGVPEERREDGAKAIFIEWLRTFQKTKTNKIESMDLRS